MTDLTTVTATELSRLYQSGTVSPVTVAQQIIDKIAIVNPKINAFCFTDPTTTLAQAIASEQRYQAGNPLSRLDGIPISVKDSISVSGWPTLHGSMDIDLQQEWSYTDAEVEVLRKSGAVFLGKTAVPEFNWRADTYSKLNGHTRNPWNLAYSPGGTSGGSAAAVAARLGPISIGSDFSGSIILPAAFCGVVGYKPSGHTVIGYFANTVADLEHLICDDKSTLNFENSLVFYMRDPQYNENVTYTDLAIELIQSKGCIIQNLDLNMDLNKIGHLWHRVGSDQYLKKLQSKHPLTKEKIESSYQFHLTSKQVNDKDVLIMQKISKNLTHKIEHYGLIICSSTSVTAFKTHEDFPSVALEKKYPNLGLFRTKSFLWNITGRPAISIPIGVARNGLPVGVQISAPVGQDQMLLKFAKFVQALFLMPAPGNLN